jgi:hypothetical protein
MLHDPITCTPRHNPKSPIDSPCLLDLCPSISAPGTIRTRNLMGRNHLLYPVELQGQRIPAWHTTPRTWFMPIRPRR